MKQSLPAAVLCLILAAALVPASSAGAETCHTFGPGQFYNAMHICVSSALASQSQNSYGPGNLADGDQNTAWCEDAPDQGVGEGEWIEIRWDSPMEFKTLWLGNGYNKNSASHFNNCRPKDVRVETSDGLATETTLLDQQSEQPIFLPRAVNADWVRITILSVYPGEKYTDTCMDEIWADLEELGF